MSVNNWLATWHAADCAAREAMGTIALQARLARDRMGEAPSEAELLQASGMREVADALLRQATIAMRRSSAVVLTSPRLGYDEMWDLALHAGSRMQADCAHASRARPAAVRMSVTGSLRESRIGLRMRAGSRCRESSRG